MRDADALGLVGDVFDALYWQTDDLDEKVALLEISSTICIDLVLGRIQPMSIPDVVAGAVAGYRRKFNVAMG